VTQPVQGSTRIAGIIGNPVTHSLSPAIWNAAFREAGLDWVFVAFPVAAGRAADALAAMRALTIAALTVTMPHKGAAAAACDDLSATATALGAVNAIVNRDGRLHGDSTDGEGFVRSLRDAGVDAKGLRCLVLGAGGAGRAIAHALGGAGAQVRVAARRLDAANDAAALAPDGHGLSMEDVGQTIRDVDLLVNATPIGMRGEPPLVDPASLAAGAVVADTVYHPSETTLLAAARAQGVRCIGGFGMLVHQAALSFRLFTGAEPSLEAMRAAVAQ
jgi:shikimate dehydrogenase